MNGNLVDSISISPIGVGEVFIIAGQSNSANAGIQRQTPSDSRVSAWGKRGWQFASDPQPIATGNGGSPWPLLGDLLATRYDMPIGFISVGLGGTKVEQWLPRSTDKFDRIVMALNEVGPQGARALLWHQGESDVGIEKEKYISIRFGS